MRRPFRGTSDDLTSQDYDYAVQQIVIPDRLGRYPDDPQCDRPYCLIPVLGRNLEDAGLESFKLLDLETIELQVGT